MAIPSVETERLVLRAFAESDADALVGILRQDGVLRYFPAQDPPSPERVRSSHVDDQRRSWTARGYGLWAAEIRASGRFIGRCGLQFLPETGEVEVDYLLDPAVWGRGYATEAAAAALDFGFREHGFDEIVGIVHPGNLASQRVLEKIGMVRRELTRYFGMEVMRYSVRRSERPPAGRPEIPPGRKVGIGL